MTALFKYPEVQNVFEQLLHKLLDESGRGAIIIGATSVEEHLTRLIDEILPNKNKKYKKRLLTYPGPLSSFSAKIELAFAFRLIDENLYNSLNALREIRNEAAHNSISFSLNEIKEKLDKVFDLGQSAQIQIRNEAIKLMIELKVLTIKSIFDQHNLTSDEKKTHVENILKNKELDESLELQVPHWELIYGLSLICGMLAYQKERTLKVLKGEKTWSLLLKENSNENEINGA